MLARVRKPEDKVEAGVLLVERWILARLRHHRFFSFNELNRGSGGCWRSLITTLSRSWPVTVGVCTRASTVRPCVPCRRPPTSLRKVDINCPIELGGHYYSVPHARPGQIFSYKDNQGRLLFQLTSLFLLFHDEIRQGPFNG
jgi:hypothetical protein